MIEVLKQALTDAKRNERHNNVAETRYWLHQYKMIAEQAIKELESQEPVACGTYQEVTDTMNALWAGTLEQVQIAEEMKNKKLYAAPPQRTWVGLTDEEIAQGCKESWVTEQAWQSAVWWAEAKLKEKNT
jgi:hypothetical protein